LGWGNLGHLFEIGKPKTGGGGLTRLLGTAKNVRVGFGRKRGKRRRERARSDGFPVKRMGVFVVLSC